MEIDREVYENQMMKFAKEMGKSWPLIESFYYKTLCDIGNMTCMIQVVSPVPYPTQHRISAVWHMALYIQSSAVIMRSNLS